jgi:HKD family nuclease
MRVILGPDQPIIEEIRAAAERHQGGAGKIAVAWAREEGVLWLLDAISGKISDLQVIVGINEGGTTVEALLRLLPEVSFLGVFYKHPRQTFHPKVYLFESEAPIGTTLIVGSSNLTRGGLITNFEVSLIIEGRETGDRALAASLRGSTTSIWKRLRESPFLIHVPSEDKISELHAAGYLTAESTVRQARQGGLGRPQPRQDIRTAPPPPVNPPLAAPLAALIAASPTVPVQKPLRSSESEDTDLDFDCFFVRTLTPNDVAKLHGRTPGTFEPDLGETARNRFPAFWGWSDRYKQVVRRELRLEWRASALLLSSRTPVLGVRVETILWYRPEREGHLPEHRIRIGPIGTLRKYVPENFDTASLLVVERGSAGVGYDFIVRFIASNDPAYVSFSRYLSDHRPGHSFGYGRL